MTVQRDYLMIQIEQLGKVLGKILADLFGLKSNNDFEKYDTVKEQLFSELGIKIDELINRNNVDFLSIVSEKLINNTLLYEKFSDVLFETGSFYNVNTDKRKTYYSKSLLLLREIVSKTQTFSAELHTKILNLEKKLETLT
ncbi:MAG: hypothetical protein L3J35_11830 [Bacteroidales bacterium]|nr:hypothetical protein [Bacteroidales bacterium]